MATKYLSLLILSFILFSSVIESRQQTTVGDGNENCNALDKFMKNCGSIPQLWFEFAIIRARPYCCRETKEVSDYCVRTRLNTREQRLFLAIRNVCNNRFLNFPPLESPPPKMDLPLPPVEPPPVSHSAESPPALVSLPPLNPLPPVSLTPSPLNSPSSPKAGICQSVMELLSTCGGDWYVDDVDARTICCTEVRKITKHCILSSLDEKERKLLNVARNICDNRRVPEVPPPPSTPTSPPPTASPPELSPPSTQPPSPIEPPSPSSPPPTSPSIPPVLSPPSQQPSPSPSPVEPPSSSPSPPSVESPSPSSPPPTTSPSIPPVLSPPSQQPSPSPSPVETPSSSPSPSPSSVEPPSPSSPPPTISPSIPPVLSPPSQQPSPSPSPVEPPSSSPSPSFPPPRRNPGVPRPPFATPPSQQPSPSPSPVEPPSPSTPPPATSPSTPPVLSPPSQQPSPSPSPVEPPSSSPSPSTPPAHGHRPPTCSVETVLYDSCNPNTPSTSNKNASEAEKDFVPQSTSTGMMVDSAGCCLGYAVFTNDCKASIRNLSFAKQRIYYSLQTTCDYY